MESQPTRMLEPHELDVMDRDAADVDVDLSDWDDEFGDGAISVQVSDDVHVSVWMDYEDAPAWVQQEVDGQLEADAANAMETRAERAQLAGGRF